MQTDSIFLLFNNRNLFTMNAEQQQKYLEALVRDHVHPAVQQFKFKGGDPDKTLWYVSNNNDTTAVMGPINFDALFLSQAGYTDEAIEQVIQLLLKAKKEGGTVITLNYKLKGMKTNAIGTFRTYFF